MLAITKKIDQMGKGSTIGQTEITTKGPFPMDWDTAKAISNRARLGSNIEDNTKTTKSAAMEK